jgi:polar amino acid transport system substrate-binding protein
VKRLALLSLTLFTIGALVLSGCTPAAKAPVKVKVATNAEFAPFEFVDEKTKEMTGFDIDLIKAIGTKAGLEFEIINTGFDAMLAGIAGCQYDAAIAAISITPERQKESLFSEPYTVAGQTVVTQINNEVIKGKDDLKGKTIGAQIGTTGAEEVQKIDGATLKTYDNYEFAFLDLANGQVDAVVVDNPIADAYVAKNASKVKTVGNVFTSENYGIAVCKTNAGLQKKINEGLAALKADGSLKSLEEKWLVPAK